MGTNWTFPLSWYLTLSSAPQFKIVLEQIPKIKIQHNIFFFLSIMFSKSFQIHLFLIKCLLYKSSLCCVYVTCFHWPTPPLVSDSKQRIILDLCPEITSVLISCLTYPTSPNQPANSVSSGLWQRTQDKAYRVFSVYHADNATNWTYRSFFWGGKRGFYDKLLIASLVCFCILLGGLIRGEENSAWPRPLWHVCMLSRSIHRLGFIDFFFSFFLLSKMSLKLEAKFIVQLMG